MLRREDEMVVSLRSEILSGTSGVSAPDGKSVYTDLPPFFWSFLRSSTYFLEAHTFWTDNHSHLRYF
jgi:hypothetical protein